MPLFPRSGRISGERFLGAYGILGGEIELFGNWVPGESPDDAAAQMLQLAGYLENTEEPLLEAAGIARADTQRRFDTETDPDGIEWIPLDPDYKAYKVGQGYPEEILQRTQQMMHAATSPGAWKVENDTLFFDPSGLPSYAMLHQIGNDPEGRAGEAAHHRELTRFRRESGEGIEKGESQKMGLGIGRGQALPARPFIGLSEEGINEIASMFDLWFDQGVEQV